MRIQDARKAFGPIATADGNVATVFTYDPATELPVVVNNAGLHLEAVLIARDSSNNVASLRMARAFKTLGGTLTALGTQASVIAVGIGDVALATIAGTLDANANIIRVRATGIAATNITWTGFMWLCASEF